MAANIKHKFSVLTSSFLLSLLERFKSIDRVAEASCSILYHSTVSLREEQHFYIL